NWLRICPACGRKCPLSTPATLALSTRFLHGSCQIASWSKILPKMLKNRQKLTEISCHMVGFNTRCWQMERANQFVGQSLAFLDAVERASRAAPLNRPVLVIGERGTGKELIAE